jgi:GH25 family lysozyme M1 (1,4-beta-N-acetylmuramidase)
MLDIEDVYAPKMMVKISADVAACAAEIKRLFGRAPIVYTAKWYWDTWIGTPTCLNRYDLAVAHYTAATAPLMPRGWTEWKIWQYSADKNGKGSEFGAQSSDIDLDKFNGDEAQFQAWAGIVAMPLTLEDKVGKLWLAHPELH